MMDDDFNLDGRWTNSSRSSTNDDHDNENEGEMIAPVGVREKILSIIPHFTGFLSIVGSTIIAYQVVKKSKDRRESSTYHHILFCLSICDIVSSFALFLSTWPLPDGTANKAWENDYHYGAVGNDATCIAQASGIQFGMVTVFYNVSLSVHYLLSVRYNVRKERMQKIYEPWLLCVPFVLALLLTIPGIFLKIYGNTSLWCWIAPDFTKCTDTDLTDCVRRAYSYRWIFYYGPVWGCIGIIGVAQVLLFVTVRSVEKRASRWNGGVGILALTAGKTNAGSSMATNVVNGGTAPMSPVSAPASLSSNIQSSLYADVERPSMCSLGGDEGGGEHVSVLKHDQDGETNQVRNDDDNKRTKLQKRRQLEEEARRSAFKRTRRVAIQASFYFAAFVVCWMPYTLTSITASMQRYYAPSDNGFWLLVTIATMQPLQGFLNCFIYYNLYSIQSIIKRIKGNKRRGNFDNNR